MEYIGTADYASPVTRDEFKRAVHLSEDDTDDHELIDGLILAATELVETATNRPMLPREYRFALPGGDWRRWWFPAAPVAEVSGIEWRAGGEWQTLDPAACALEHGFDEPQLLLPTDYMASRLGALEMRVTAVAGFGTGAAPLRMKRAVIFIVKDWLDAGIAVDHSEHMRVSFGCKIIIKQARYRRPHVVAGA